MDRQKIIDCLGLAEKLITEDQRRRVAEHIREGRPVSESKTLLDEFEKALAMHIADRDRLLKALDDPASAENH